MTVGNPRNSAQMIGSAETFNAASPPARTQSLHSHLHEALDECDRLLEHDASFRAIQQLDARALAGDTVTAIDQTILRERLNRQLENNPIWQSRQALTTALSALKALDSEPSEATLQRCADHSQHVEKLSQSNVPYSRRPTPKPAIPRPELNLAALYGPVSVDPDNLTHIRGITPGLAAALTDRGLTKIAQIASLTRSDIRALSSELDLGLAIQHQNWIEQAAILSEGNPTHHLRLGAPVAVAYDYVTPCAAIPATPEQAKAPLITPPDEDLAPAKEKRGKRMYHIQPARRPATYFTIPYQTNEVEDLTPEDLTPAAHAPQTASTSDDKALDIEIVPPTAPVPVSLGSGTVTHAAPSEPDQTLSAPAYTAPNQDRRTRTWAADQTQAPEIPIAKRTYSAPAHTASPDATARFSTALNGPAPASTRLPTENEAEITIRSNADRHDETPEPLSYRLAEGRPDYATGSEDFFEPATMPEVQRPEGYGAYHIEVEEALVEFRAAGTFAESNDPAAEENRNLFLRRSTPQEYATTNTKQRVGRFFQALTGGEPAKRGS